jgi:6-pyruvoyltetrahydropterin/6-carboxytetrahydropterin synthase
MAPGVPCRLKHPTLCFLRIFVLNSIEMIYITRKASFNAAHKLARPDWTLDQNREVFGKCSNPNWHGHNYQLYVTVKGEVNPETGFLVDLKWLKDITNTYVVDKIDHMNLNLDVDFMKGKLASTENLVIAVWDILFPHIEAGGATLHSIKIYETENNFVEYFG